MRVPSRLTLSVAVACGAALAAATPGFAQEDGEGLLGAPLCGSLKALADPTIGCVDEAGNGAQKLEDSGDEGGAEDTPPAGAQEEEDPDSQESSGDPVADDTDDDGSVATPVSGTSGSDSGPVDRDNGDAPKGGIETGAGGTADGSDALPASLAGGVIVAAGGMVFAQRRHGRHARHSRHSL